MSDETNVENQIEQTKDTESSPTETESNMDDGAKLLEKPQGGDFVNGLQGFIAWLHDLFAKQK